MESGTEFNTGNGSPVLAGTESTQRRRESRHKRHRRMERPDTSTSRSPSPDISPNVNASKKKGCKKSSTVWNHCYQKTIDGKTVTYCNYCVNQYWILGGSTSTALYHIKQHHGDKLTAEELSSFTKKTQGTEITSPTSRLPVRTPPHSTLFPKIKQNSTRGRDLNIKLMLAMISSSVSFNILDNPEWGIFVESLSCNQYHLPSRQYMNGQIVPVIYAACQKAVSEKIKNIRHIALTTDAWKSLAKQ